MIYDVIVVGAGHAGVEASLAAARMGRKTLLLTINIDQVAAMSCNPAIGGLAKGHLVREIDALGGEMGLAIDATGIQFRTLNASKGPAVQAFRAQADRRLYREYMRQQVEQTLNLQVRQGSVIRLVVTGDNVTGVELATGEIFNGNTVVITTGTFLNGLMHIGATKISAGRAGDPPSIGLSDNLRELGFEVGRLKTGTCPRLDRDTIDFSRTEEQQGDEDPRHFSFWSDHISQRQVSCHITYTTEATQEVIENNLHRSPLFSGQIEGVGPRYCPSIEDKVKKFPAKRSHQIFLEPEGLTTKEIYPNGLSTSLPVDVQQKFLRTIIGLEQVEIMRPGYAIEYDFCQPTQLYPTLETKPIHNLYFAGQINGTSGYEEAAAQGIVAGINAALRSAKKEPIIFTRQNSYIGVLIDDLVTKGTEEPYRMFTSRAEFRLMLRQDNADSRLCEIGRAVGLLADEKYKMFVDKQERLAREFSCLRSNRIKRSLISEGELAGKGDETITLYDALKRPEVTIDTLPQYMPQTGCTREDREQLEIAAKYEGYITRQQKLIHKTKEAEQKAIPQSFDYREVPGISIEVAEKLERVRPQSLGQASRISGVTPAAVSILHIYLEKLRRDSSGKEQR